MYVRMSTEHQQYSTKNQLDAIEKYAARQGLTIVKHFVDSGKSGLTLSRRPALRDLLRQVETGNAGFEVILVYDVSRWVGSRMSMKVLTTNTSASGRMYVFTTASNRSLTMTLSLRRY